MDAASNKKEPFGWAKFNHIKRLVFRICVSLSQLISSSFSYLKMPLKIKFFHSKKKKKMSKHKIEFIEKVEILFLWIT